MMNMKIFKIFMCLLLVSHLNIVRSPDVDFVYYPEDKTITNDFYVRDGEIINKIIYGGSSSYVDPRNGVVVGSAPTTVNLKF